MNGYEPPEPEPDRRTLKGYFMLNYPTSGDLFLKERKLTEVTNPVAVAKQRHFEAWDRKNLEKRREQKILTNKAARV